MPTVHYASRSFLKKIGMKDIPWKITSDPKNDDDSRDLTKSKAAALYEAANKERRLSDAIEDTTILVGHSQVAAKVSIDLIGDADPNDAAPKLAPALKDSSTARSIPKKGTAPSDLHKMRVRKSKPPSSNKDSNSEKKNSPPEVSTGTWACQKCTKDNPAEHSRYGVCYRKGGRRDKQKVAIIDDDAKQKKKSTTLTSSSGGKSSQVNNNNKVPFRKSTVTTPSQAHPTVTEKESKYPALQAPEFGENWTVCKIPRATGKHLDKYYYSPVMGYRFRSKLEVNRYLECIKRSNGDEIVAIGEFRSSKRPSLGGCDNPTNKKKKMDDTYTKDDSIACRDDTDSYAASSLAIEERDGAPLFSSALANNSYDTDTPTHTSNANDTAKTRFLLNNASIAEVLPVMPPNVRAAAENNPELLSRLIAQKRREPSQQSETKATTIGDESFVPTHVPNTNVSPEQHGEEDSNSDEEMGAHLYKRAVKRKRRAAARAASAVNKILLSSKSNSLVTLAADDKIGRSPGKVKKLKRANSTSSQNDCVPKEKPKASKKPVTFNCPHCLKNFTYSYPPTAAASFSHHTRACDPNKKAKPTSPTTIQRLPLPNRRKRKLNEQQKVSFLSPIKASQKKGMPREREDTCTMYSKGIGTHETPSMRDILSQRRRHTWTGRALIQDCAWGSLCGKAVDCGGLSKEKCEKYGSNGTHVHEKPSEQQVTQAKKEKEAARVRAYRQQKRRKEYAPPSSTLLQTIFYPCRHKGCTKHAPSGNGGYCPTHTEKRTIACKHEECQILGVCIRTCI